MIINAVNPNTSDPGFLQDEQTAIAILDAAFTANITVNIEIHLGDINGQALPGPNTSEGNINNFYGYSYSQLRTFLINAADPGFFNNANLPNTASINGISNFWISSTQARIFGVLPAGDVNNTDGFVGIGTGFQPGAERISAFLHEIGHALGRVNSTLVSRNGTTYYSNLDLWRFTSQGVHLFDGNISPSNQHGVTPAYFSLDGGVSKVADWGIYSDPSDFLNPQNNQHPAPYSNLTPNDPFDEIVGNLGNLTNTDLLIGDALGFRHTRPGAIPVIGAGDFNSNGNPDFIWSGNSFLSMWEYNPAAQTVSNTALASVPGWAPLGSAHFSNANGASASSTQMLMDYVPNGTMTLWWVTNGGGLNGINLGQQWPNIGFIANGQFTNLGGANITNFLVTNVVDHHIYDWWVSPQNQLTGFDLTARTGISWANVSLVTVGQFTANGGTNLLVSNNIDHHLYDWWITSNNTLGGIDLGPYWANVSIVANGQFTANGGTNFLVSNNIDHHLYDWWIGSNNTLQGIDLGAHWAGVQLVTVGRFDNNTTNTQFLVQNTVDHHLYEWWIAANNTLTGLDLGPYWSNVQLIGNSHYNNNSAFNELLVRNTSDFHFYEWWIANNRLAGVDLGAVAGGAAGAAAGGVGADAVDSAGPLDASTAAVPASLAGGDPSGAAAAAAGSAPILPATSSDPTALMVQAMASFGAGGALNSAPLLTSDPGPQSAFGAAADPRSAHS